jgi:quercetin dioxygenase-like cupin family protein
MWKSLAVASFVVLGIVGAGCSSDTSSPTPPSTSTAVSQITTDRPEVSTVLDKQTTTVLGQVFQYSLGSPAQVSSIVLTFAPGASTGLHMHEAPVYVYVMEGTITVLYDGGIEKTYPEGSAMLEGNNSAHNGENRTDKIVKLLVVYMGAEGVSNSVWM